jgi:hypothetical protein
VRDFGDGPDLVVQLRQQLLAVAADHLAQEVVAPRGDDDVVESRNLAQQTRGVLEVGALAQGYAEPGHRPEAEVQRVADGDDLQGTLLDQAVVATGDGSLGEPEPSPDVPK